MKRTWSFAALIVLVQFFGWVAPADSANTLVLEDAFLPDWSPDDTEFVCSRPIGDDWYTTRIWRVSASGQDATVVNADTLGAYYPLWLPDGDHIVYYRPGPEFVVFDLLGGPSTVWPVSDIWDDPGMCLTPDGTEVLYTVLNSRGRETWALDLSDGNTRFVWPGYGGTISPDGEWIAFFTDGDSLAVAPFAGGPVHRFEVGGFARWTPDGEHIVFTGMGASESGDIVVVSRDGSGRLELTGDALFDWNSAVSPDGDVVIYSRSVSHNFMPPYDVWVVDLETPSPVERETWGRMKSRYR